MPTLNFGPGSHSVVTSTTDTALRLPTGAGGTNQGATTSTIPAVTGDLDLRAYINMADWTPTADFNVAAIIGNWDGTNGDFALLVGSTGLLTIAWVNTGGTNLNRSSTMATGFTDGTPHWIRATLTVNNGASGHTARFYTSNDPATTAPGAVSWTQLGSDVVTAGVTTVRNSTDNGFVGQIDTVQEWAGHFFVGEMRNGIGGTVVASPDFRNLTPGATSMVDGQGNTWTVASSSTVQSVLPPGPVDFDLRGAKGGNRFAAAGGSGARVQGTLSVVDGNTLYLFVGAAGVDSTTSTGSAGGSGFGSGANGGNGANAFGSNPAGAGGGAATDLRLNGVAVGNRRAVAAAGGGATGSTGTGGDGGHPSGEAGAGSGGGPGGTQTQDGAGGSSIAGTGGQAGDLTSNIGGGGGGGGWRGGRGGFRASTGGNAGGGGSSWTDPVAVTNVTHTNGENAGAGTADVTFASVVDANAASTLPPFGQSAVAEVIEPGAPVDTDTTSILPAFTTTATAQVVGAIPPPGSPGCCAVPPRIRLACECRC